MNVCLLCVDFLMLIVVFLYLLLLLLYSVGITIIRQLRVSIQGDEVGDKPAGPITPGAMSESSFPPPEDGGFPIPEDGSEDGQGPTAAGGADGDDLHNLSFSRDSLGGAGAANVVGGLDDSADLNPDNTMDAEDDEEGEQAKKKRKKQPEGPKRRRTRRKVVIDNDATELDGDHIKNMLHDTSDITLQHVPHPADFSAAEAQSLMSHSHQEYRSLASMSLSMQDNESLAGATMTTVETTATVAATRASDVGQDDRLLLDNLTFEQLLARPALGDDGQLAPELLRLWSNNLARIQGKPWPYKKRATIDEDEEEEVQDEEVEVARNHEEEELQSDEDESTSGKKKKEADDASVPGEVNGEAANEKNEDDDSAAGGPITQREDDDDGMMPMMDDEDGVPPVPFDDEEEEKPHAKSDDEDDSTRASGQEEQAEAENQFGLSTWGLVNDATKGDDEDSDDRDDEDDPRQAAGTELVSSASKWHKHTVRVLELFQRTMGNKGGDLDPLGKKKAESLEFGELSKNCSRRTAAGVFFEILQLKTWDFIEVDQGESYGPITVCFVLFFFLSAWVCVRFRQKLLTFLCNCFIFQISPGVRFDEDPPSD